jgi:hypothetical protein
MAKEVSFGSQPPRARAEALDAFVHGGQSAEPAPTREQRPRVPMKRLTFDIPADLHRRMKLACVREERDMADVIRELLQGRFP